MSSKFVTSFHRLTPLIGLGLFTLASVMIWRTMHAYHWSDIQHALMDMPIPVILASVIIALLGYLALSLYDCLALRYAKETLPYPSILLASFLGYAISNNVGHALVSGGTMRYRIYSRLGLSAASVARIILFCSSSYVVGAVLLLVAIYSVMGFPPPPNPQLPSYVIPVFVSIGIVLLMLWWTLILNYHHRPLTVKKFELYLPNPLLALFQSIAAVLDILLAAVVLYIPLYSLAPVDFSMFLLIYLLAQLVGLGSQVPGGVGVFEGSFLFLSPQNIPPASILAALIIYRMAYYFIPLIMAGCIWIGYEARHVVRRERIF